MGTQRQLYYFTEIILYFRIMLKHIVADELPRPSMCLRYTQIFSQ